MIQLTDEVHNLGGNCVRRLGGHINLDFKLSTEMVDVLCATDVTQDALIGQLGIAVPTTPLAARETSDVLLHVTVQDD